MRTTGEKTSFQNGQLLVEALIAIALAAIVVSLGVEMIYSTLMSDQLAGRMNVAAGLIEETLETVESIATEKWQDIYNLTKGSAEYYPQQSSGKWIAASGAESVSIDGVNYSRSFTVQNVCRETDSSKDVTGITDSNGSTTTCVQSGGSFDPSTQKINAAVSWPGGNPVTASKYLSRWRNKVCLQTSWSSSGSGPSNCPVDVYESKSGINTAGGKLELCESC